MNQYLLGNSKLEDTKEFQELKEYIKNGNK